MKIQVYAGDRFHPEQTVRDGFVSLAAHEGLALDWIPTVEHWSHAMLSGCDAVLLAKSNVISPADWRPWITAKNETALRDYVCAGGGLVVVHSGCASYSPIGPMLALMGGQFTQHPPQCAVLLEPVPLHALTAGVDAAFTVHDEHYFINTDDPRLNVFLRSHSVHGVQPAGWIREEGRGRVCVLTPGHNVEVWRHPSFQILILNALRWVTRKL